MRTNKQKKTGLGKTSLIQDSSHFLTLWARGIFTQVRNEAGDSVTLSLCLLWEGCQLTPNIKCSLKAWCSCSQQGCFVKPGILSLSTWRKLYTNLVTTFSLQSLMLQTRKFFKKSFVPPDHLLANILIKHFNNSFTLS